MSWLLCYTTLSLFYFFSLSLSLPPLPAAQLSSFLCSSLLFCVEAVSLILEFLGIRPSAAQRKLTRNALLREQLQPSGEFCGSSQVEPEGKGGPTGGKNMEEAEGACQGQPDNRVSWHEKFR